MPKAARKSSIKRASVNDRYVIPSKSRGGWDIVKEGHRRATGHATTKADAIRDAKRSVSKEGGGELRIMNRYGKLTDSDTVPSAPRRRK